MNLFKNISPIPNFLNLVNTNIMHKISAIILLSFLTLNSFSQAPKSINYQAVARDNAGKVLANKTVSLRLSILDSTATGTAVYIETHSATTNAFGLFTLGIGNGSVVSGTFSNINWGGSNKFLKTEMDATGGTSYSVLGTSQFLSVPYALYAEKSGSSLRPGNGINISGDSIHNIAQDKVVTVTGGGATTVSGTYPNFTITSTDTKGDADSSATNELQNLSITGRQLSISSGNSVYVPADADSSVTNELQTITRTNGTITLSNGGGSIALPDSSATNELQILTRKGDTLFLSNGGKVLMPDSNYWNKNGSNISYTKGNVGVGTNTPNARLHIEDSANAEALKINRIGSTNTGMVGFYNNNKRMGGFDANPGIGLTYYDEASKKNIMTLDTSGNVGIGTSKADAKLEVTGMIHSSKLGYKFPDSSVQVSAAHTYHAGKGILLKNDTFSLDTNYVLQNLAFNPEYPDGTSSIVTVAIDISNSSYTVPLGKNLHVIKYLGSDSLVIDSINTGARGIDNFIVGSGKKLSIFKIANGHSGLIQGYLSDAHVIPVILKASTNTTYTVPVGKKLYETYHNPSFCTVYLGGNALFSSMGIFTQGNTIKLTGDGCMFGFLK
ncbi:MAG: hypothetical protein NTX03_05825 [Bacteroidetes bacterium]|nr:hypothetical protein [Bacteroidota bacterium]